MSSSLNLPSKCNSYAPSKDTANLGAMGNALLDKMGIDREGCDLTSWNAAMAAKASAGPAGLAGKVEASIQASGLTKAGCQAIAVLLGNYYNSIYTARCIIENDKTSTISSLTLSQDASLNAIGPNSRIFCDSLTTNLVGGITVKTISQISDTSISTIASVAQAGLSNTADQLGIVKDGFQSTDSGSKMIQGMQNELRTQAQDSNVKSAITQAKNMYTVNQNGSINATSGGTVTISGPCKITDNAWIDAQIANIVSNAYQTQISEAFKAFLSSKQSQKHISKNTGVPDDIGAMFKNNWMYIVGAVVAIVLGIILLKFLKSKNAAKLIEKASKKAPR
jgi:hypothetical protein